MWAYQNTTLCLLWCVAAVCRCKGRLPFCVGPLIFFLFFSIFSNRKRKKGDAVGLGPRKHSAARKKRERPTRPRRVPSTAPAHGQWARRGRGQRKARSDRDCFFWPFFFERTPAAVAIEKKADSLSKRDEQSSRTNAFRFAESLKKKNKKKRDAATTRQQQKTVNIFFFP